MLAALRPLTPNTVLILPDGDEEIKRGMFARFEEVAKAGGMLRVRVLFPSLSVVIPAHMQDATSQWLKIQYSEICKDKFAEILNKLCKYMH